MKPNHLKLQAAMDFFSSYGIALAVMLAAFVAVYEIALTPNHPAIFCTPVPGFTCDYISVNSVGAMTLKISQAIGTQIYINGVACSSVQSASTDTPQFGNVGVNSISTYYPSSQNPTTYPNNVIYSGSSIIMYLNCYNYQGLASGTTGQAFSGFIWLNYTIPNYGSQTQKIATFSAIYS